MTNLPWFGALGAYAAVGLIVGTVAGGRYARDWSADEIVAYAVCSTLVRGRFHAL